MFTDDLSMPGKPEFGGRAGEYQPIRIDCRARAGEIFTACLRDKPQLCQHSICIDGSHICNHPMRREIVERTRRAA